MQWTDLVPFCVRGLGLWVQSWHSQDVPGGVMELSLCLGHIAGPDPFLTALEAEAKAGEKPHPPHFIFLWSQEVGKHMFGGGQGEKGDFSKVMIHPTVDPCDLRSLFVYAPHFFLFSSSDKYISV